MSHPEFYEHAYTFVHHASQAGLQGQLAPCRGCRGVPCFLSSRAACGGAQKKKKEVVGDTLHPSWDDSCL